MLGILHFQKHRIEKNCPRSHVALVCHYSGLKTAWNLIASHENTKCVLSSFKMKVIAL